MAKRKALSKRVRFEVFKRDSFSCQYCGKSAPDVVLHVDHINPVAEGGTNDIVNLLTACMDCNGGKGAVALDDNSAAAKQMRQLKEINERREQIQLIAKWREELLKLDDEQIDIIDRKIKELCGIGLSVYGRNKFKTSLRKYGFSAVLEALDTSARQYLTDPEDKECVEKFINYTHRICHWNKEKAEKPEVEDFMYICNLAQKNWWTCNRHVLWRVISDAYYKDDVPTDFMIQLARTTTGIMKFEDGLRDFLGGDNG